jgi:hypothetical protein
LTGFVFKNVKEMWMRMNTAIMERKGTNCFFNKFCSDLLAIKKLDWNFAKRFRSFHNQKRPLQDWRSDDIDLPTMATNQINAIWIQEAPAT